MQAEQWMSDMLYQIADMTAQLKDADVLINTQDDTAVQREQELVKLRECIELLRVQHQAEIDQLHDKIELLNSHCDQVETEKCGLELMVRQLQYDERARPTEDLTVINRSLYSTGT